VQICDRKFRSHSGIPRIVGLTTHLKNGAQTS
jgi:hypothetical protein